MKEQDSHRHHQVPQHYLKGFGVKPSYQYASISDIWVYTKGGVTPKLEAINDTAFVEDFYKFEREDGEIDYNTYEIFFNNSFESPATTILNKIRNKQSISNVEKRKLSRYICLMMIRGKFGQKIFFDGRTIERIELKENLEKQGCSEDETVDGIKQLMFIQEKEIKGERDNIRRKEIAEKYADLIYNLNWQFLLAPNSFEFMTCDNPVSWKELDTEQAWLLFPISPQVCLLASFISYPKHDDWNEEDGFWKIDNTVFEGICDKIVRRAIFEVYFLKKAEWMVNFVNNRLN
jgi:hypothetical protein